MGRTHKLTVVGFGFNLLVWYTWEWFTEVVETGTTELRNIRQGAGQGTRTNTLPFGGRLWHSGMTITAFRWLGMQMTHFIVDISLFALQLAVTKWSHLFVFRFLSFSSFQHSQSSCVTFGVAFGVAFSAFTFSAFTFTFMA